MHLICTYKLDEIVLDSRSILCMELEAFAVGPHNIGFVAPQLGSPLLLDI